MTTINAVSSFGNSSQIKKMNNQPSFNGTNTAVSEQKSNVMDLGVKVGLAIAAAVGIGLAIKNGKAAKAAQETAENLQTKLDDAQKAAKETIDGLQGKLDDINIQTATALARKEQAKIFKAMKKIKDEPFDGLCDIKLLKRQGNIVEMSAKYKERNLPATIRLVMSTGGESVSSLCVKYSDRVYTIGKFDSAGNCYSLVSFLDTTFLNNLDEICDKMPLKLNNEFKSLKAILKDQNGKDIGNVVGHYKQGELCSVSTYDAVTKQTVTKKV